VYKRQLQEKLLTCWQDNIVSLRVQGDFDACQKLVKEAFADQKLAEKYHFSSANSINIGRLLPQCVYYATSALTYWQRKGSKPSFIVPTGNMGNVVGAIWARKMGFPIDKIIMACNANKVIPQYFAEGLYRPQPSVKTLANAMDVGNPSNMERFRDTYPNLDEVRDWLSADSIDDAGIKEAIKNGVKKWNRIWCPHTAVAAAIRERQAGSHWVIVATAHPAKFADIVEPLINKSIELPESLAQEIARPSKCYDIKPELGELEKFLRCHPER
jgi:threonine synthase